MARKPARVSDAEALKQLLRATDNADVRELMEKKRLRSAGEVMEMLGFLTPSFIAGRLSERERALFEALRIVYRSHCGAWYEPEGFFHSSFPEAQAELARIYHYPARLKSAALNPHTPRSHLYAAWKLGLIDEEEMWNAPPMYRRQSFFRRKRKFKKAPR